MLGICDAEAGASARAGDGLQPVMSAPSMWLKALVGFFVILFGLMYWQAPNSQRGVVDTVGQADEWQKLKQHIQAHQQRFTPFRRNDAQRAVEHASVPQLTEASAASDSTPVQEEVAEAPAKAEGPFNKKVDGTRASAEQRTHLAPQEKQVRPKRLVRVTTYEDGRPVRVRTFQVGPALRGGPPHRRYYVACPGGKCRPLTAAMFGPGGEFN
jgi:hypothetical protein